MLLFEIIKRQGEEWLVVYMIKIISILNMLPFVLLYHSLKYTFHIQTSAQKIERKINGLFVCQCFYRA